MAVADVQYFKRISKNTQVRKFQTHINYFEAAQDLLSQTVGGNSIEV